MPKVITRNDINGLTITQENAIYYENSIFYRARGSRAKDKAIEKEEL